MLEKIVTTGVRLNPEILQGVIALRSGGALGERLQQRGIEVETLGGGSRSSVWRRAGTLPWRIGARAGRPVVQTWLWHADLVGALAARLGGNPRVVWNLRNTMPALRSTPLRSRQVARACALTSRWLPAKIICNSQAVLEAHVAIGYDRSRCVVIPNGFDLARFRSSATLRAQTRARWGVTAEELVVGMVARLHPQKDHATFIRAAAQVAVVLPQARFVLVGAGVDSDPALRGLLDELALGGKFRLEGGREDVVPVLNGLDVFCLSSQHSEGFPNVLGEAMACGCPTVSTDTGAAREIVGERRFIAPVGDAAALAACVLAVLRLPAEARQALGRTQRESVASRFAIESVWGRYREVYQSL